MTKLEKKVNALISLCTARDEQERQAALQALEKLRRGGSAGEQLHTAAHRLLRELGVPEHLSGYGYLLDAVVLAAWEPGYLRRVTTELYPAVAKKYGSTPSRVERAMRHAIETAWTRCSLETIDRYFGNTVSPVRGKPVNSEFIARVSGALRLGE